MPDIVYEKEGITLYCADNKEVLPFLEDESVDLILSDPPYGMAYASNMRKTHKDDPLVKEIKGDKDLGALQKILYQLNRVLKPDRHSYFFANPLLSGDVIKMLSAGWTIKSLMVWYKGLSPGLGDLESYGSNWEAIIFGMKGRRPLFEGRLPNVYQLDWNSQRDPVHPTTKPVPLLMWLIKNSTAPGELVLDPFGGSGTTAMAAKLTGRRCISIEIDEHFSEVSARRLSQESIDLNSIALPETSLDEAVAEAVATSGTNIEANRDEGRNTDGGENVLQSSHSIFISTPTYTPSNTINTQATPVVKNDGVSQIREKVVGRKKADTKPSDQPSLFDR